MRAEFLPFALPDVGDDEKLAVAQVIDSCWLTTGRVVHSFEVQLSFIVGSIYCLALNSATAALHLALEAIGLTRGDEVLVPTYTFAATAEVVRYFDATPVLVDVDPETFNIDWRQFESKITAKTKAIIPVDIAGLPVDYDEINRIAKKHGLIVIADAAHSFPTKYKGRWVGSLCDFTCFSFYATKTITTGEGGMICTDNQEWADRCRIMALHGISRDAWKRYTKEGSWYYEITAPGYKYNLTDIAAAIGLVQLAKAERMRARREWIARQYDQAFAGLHQLQIPANPAEHQHSWHLYMLRLNLERLKINRDVFFDQMKERNIGCSVHFIPLHIHPYYREKYGYKPEDFPVAYREFKREISLPIYSKMTDEDVRSVIEAVKEIVSLNQA